MYELMLVTRRAATRASS